jgi:hypothetical protein
VACPVFVGGGVYGCRVANTACSTVEREHSEIMTAEEWAWLAEMSEGAPGDELMPEGMGDEELQRKIQEYGEKIARLKALRARVAEQWDGPP